MAPSSALVATWQSARSPGQPPVPVIPLLPLRWEPSSPVRVVLESSYPCGQFCFRQNGPFPPKRPQHFGSKSRLREEIGGKIKSYVPSLWPCLGQHVHHHVWMRDSGSYVDATWRGPPEPLLGEAGHPLSLWVPTNILQSSLESWTALQKWYWVTFPLAVERAKGTRCCTNTQRDLVILCQVMCRCQMLHPALLGTGPSWAMGYSVGPAMRQSPIAPLHIAWLFLSWPPLACSTGRISRWFLPSGGKKLNNIHFLLLENLHFLKTTYQKWITQCDIPT